MTTTLGPAEQTAAASEADTLHRDAIVIDASIVVEQSDAHLRRARDGGVTAVNHTVTHPDNELQQTLDDIIAFRRWVRSHSDEALLVTSSADIDAAKRDGKEAMIIGPQNAAFISQDLAVLEVAHALGVRVLQLTYQTQNYIGSGCGETNDDGLSRFGRAAVREMNELGIVVDLSHCGQQTSLDAIEASQQPVVFSHAHPAAKSPHIRAKDDHVIVALAERGGVIGLTGLSFFLYDPDSPRRRPTLDDFVGHLRHIVDLVGVDHVGVGLDFDETNTMEKWAADMARHPELDSGWEWASRKMTGVPDISQRPRITQALLDAGFGAEDVRKFLGLNFLRVFRTVWGA